MTIIYLQNKPRIMGSDTKDEPKLMQSKLLSYKGL